MRRFLAALVPALFLIRYQDSPCPSNEVGCYKRGDIVEVRASGAYIAPGERGGPFWLVDVTDLPLADALIYAEKWNNPDETLNRKRLWWLDYSTFTPQQQQNMENFHATGGIFEMSWAVARAKIFNKQTGLNP